MMSPIIKFHNDDHNYNNNSYNMIMCVRLVISIMSIYNHLILSG